MSKKGFEEGRALWLSIDVAGGIGTAMPDTAEYGTAGLGNKRSTDVERKELSCFAGGEYGDSGNIRNYEISIIHCCRG